MEMETQPSQVRIQHDYGNLLYRAQEKLNKLFSKNRLVPSAICYVLLYSQAQFLISSTFRENFRVQMKSAVVLSLPS